MAVLGAARAIMTNSAVGKKHRQRRLRKMRSQPMWNPCAVRLEWMMECPCGPCTIRRFMSCDEYALHIINLPVFGIAICCNDIRSQWARSEMMRVHEARDTLLKAARDGRLASAFKEMRQAGLKVENDCWATEFCQSVRYLRNCGRYSHKKKLLGNSKKFNKYTLIFLVYTSSTAQGGGGSFKNRKRIGEIGRCESQMSAQNTDQLTN